MVVRIAEWRHVTAHDRGSMSHGYPLGQQLAGVSRGEAVYNSNTILLQPLGRKGNAL